MNIEVFGEITIPQNMRDPVLEALEHAGLEPEDVHVDVGEVTITVSHEVYDEALEVVDSILLGGF